MRASATLHLEAQAQERRIHQIFVVSILIKGAHALIECVSGMVLAFVSTSSIVGLINRLTQEELVHNPHDFVALHLLDWAQTFSIQAQHFYAFYLFSHGVAKLLLVVGLLREKLWAYPASLAVLGLFIVYQLYRYSYTHGIGLIVLSIFDVVIIGLVWHEYRLVRWHLPTQ